MKETTTQAAITVSLTDLEAMIRRVVREELGRLIRQAPPSILDDWSQEGPDDPEGDRILLEEALKVSAERKRGREGWKTLEEFEKELEAEPAHEVHH